jgi:polyisoprenoid-binding protein YceI
MTDIGATGALKDMKTLKLLVLAAAIAASPACKKKDEAKKDMAGSSTTMTGSQTAPTPPPTPDQQAAGSGSAMAGGSAATQTPTPPPPPAEDTSDWITVYATHVEKKPTDPVEVKFEKFKVVKAKFDPKKIEGGTATIEIDLTSLKTGEAKRDEHLQTPDYLDAKKYATATVDISNVKKKDDKHYTADAKVKVHNIEKKFPVTFEVVDAKDDWVRIKGEHTFHRLDFKVGKKPGPDQKKDDGVADEMTVKMQLTLKKT